MAVTVTVLLLLVFMAEFLHSQIVLGRDDSDCKYVTIPLCNEEDTAKFLTKDTAVRGPVGPPGKSGAKGGPGPKGYRGEAGPKGEKGTAFDMGAVEALIDRKLKDFECNVLKRSEVDFCRNVNTPGVYRHCDGLVECDGLGWTLLQKRHNGSLSFDRTWTEYNVGFGNVGGEFWIGLQKIHQLTRNHQCRVRFDLEKFGGSTAYAEYSSFAIAGEDEKFRISISGFSGTAGDSMDYHDGMFFTTKDVDNDKAKDKNCAIGYGGWWYDNCFRVSLNGVLGESSKRRNNIIWNDWKGLSKKLEKTVMKIQCQ